jgi:hypothetical protein
MVLVQPDNQLKAERFGSTIGVEQPEQLALDVDAA